MDKEATSDKRANGQEKTSWFIALDWFTQNNRSFSTLVRDYLCPNCARKLSEKGKAESPDAILSTITDCCAQVTDFINERLPILECIFRLFLTNGNQPLDLEELGQQLSERRGGDSHRTSVEMLSRLLENDQRYGLRQAPD